MAKKRSESMEENRARLLAAARKAFAEKGYMAASMDDFTAEAGLTRGALYHAFGDKRGLFAAVVHQVDSEMAARARAMAAQENNAWDALLTEAAAYIEMALDAEVQRIVLLDGPAVLGDPSQWPSQSSCLIETRDAVAKLMAEGLLKPVDPDAAARLLTGAALNAALWVAASSAPDDALPKAVAAFRALSEGMRTPPGSMS